jgi:hypothetical protein
MDLTDLNHTPPESFKATPIKSTSTPGRAVGRAGDDLTNPGADDDVGPAVGPEHADA